MYNFELHCAKHIKKRYETLNVSVSFMSIMFKIIDTICDPFWHSESDVAQAEYLVSPIMP